MDSGVIGTLDRRLALWGGALQKVAIWSVSGFLPSPVCTHDARAQRAADQVTDTLGEKPV